MRTHIRISVAILILSSALVMTGGCGNEQDDHTYGKRHMRQNTIKPLNRISSDGKAIPNDGSKSLDHEVNSKRSRISDDQLAHIAESVPGVKSAIVVMNDTDALVGLEIENVGSRKIIEKQVMSALTWQYPEYHYHITASEELRERIKTVSARKTEGYQAQMFNQDIGVLAEAIDLSSIRP